MALLSGDPTTQLAFSIFENKGVYALLLGSGLSRAAGIPTGWEITLDLVRRVALAKQIEDQPDWAKWYRETEKAEPNYSLLLAELAMSPAERRAVLHTYIEPNDEDRAEGLKLPTAAHYAVAELVRSGYIRVIITTNFDRLMENALRERGVEPTVVASADALAGAEPLTHSQCYILKLHGDYKDARILNTEEELNGYSAQYDSLLDRIFDEYGIVSCGWSGEWDHALRAAFLRAPSRRYSMFWAARGGLGDGAREIVNHRRARVVSISDADIFFSGLQQRITTLEQSQRQNPATVDLLVKSTKRFLAKLEYRIQLDELFAEELARCIEKLDAKEFAPLFQWDVEEFRVRVTRYEAATEALATMCGVLGRWGNDGELPLCIDIIRSLYRQAANSGGGVNFYVNIRSYPAVLAFTAYGVGLTRAGRWKILHQFFDSVIDRPSGKPKRAIETFFLDAWKGTDGEVWNNIKGLERHQTPLSERLFFLFSDWGRRFAGVTPDFELMFEKFEMLGALAHLERYSKVDVQQLIDSTQHDVAWMAVGRAVWHDVNGSLLINEIERAPLKTALAQAGFGKGDPGFIDVFAKNFKRMAARMH